MNKIQNNLVTLENGITISYYHEQECCEDVYADFEALKDTTFENEVIEIPVIEKVTDKGIRINGYFVPCYNSQNGYYSNDLSLIIKSKNGEVLQHLDITSCTKDCGEQEGS